MRWQLAVVVVALAACDSEDRSCVPTQYKLTFRGSDIQPDEYLDDDTTARGPIAVAVGGTERFTVGALDDCGSAGGPGPVIVTNGDPSVATVTETDATIDIQGLAPGAAWVDVTDTLPMTASLHLGVRPIESVHLVADEIGEPGAFFVGIPHVKLKLLDAEGYWLVDRALAVAGDIPQGSAWDLLDTAGAGVGDHAVTLKVGASSYPVTATIVDHIDDIVAGMPKALGSSSAGKRVCFFAHTDGAEVAGVPWTFDLESMVGVVTALPNCVVVTPRDRSQRSTTITAHALGLSTTTTVTFAQ